MPGRTFPWLTALLAVVFFAGCAGHPPTAGPDSVDPVPSRFVPADWPLYERAVAIEAPSAMVSSAHPLASEIGASILERGGKAVDAAVAVGFALAVVHPEAGNIGGGGFMVIRFADGTVHTIDYRETAPARASRDMYLDETGELTDKSLIGHLAAGVPGSVAGLVAAQERFGRLTLAEVIAPAIRVARDGFTLDEYRSASLRKASELLARFPDSRRQFLLPSGEAPPAGSLLVQGDLARTLQAIADGGRRAFYEGHIADLIVAEMERGGGLISREDLASYEAIWREPITFDYRGYTIHSMAPASSGGVTMGQILNVYELLGPPAAHGSGEQIHLLIEAMRRAFSDRNHFLGDPAFVEMPVDRLISESYAREQVATIDRSRATPTAASTPGFTDGDHTTHYSVVDPDGTAVSVTTTINGSYGNYVTVAGAGFLLNNEMDDFAAAPGRPNMYGLVQGEANAIEPGKRMLSSMTPTIVLDPDGRLFMVVGTPGGSTIITTVTQVISNVIDHGMTLADAISAPRVHHQALPDAVFFEPGGLMPEVVAELETMGHDVEERSGYSGFVAGIIRTANGWVGVSDPRGDGGSEGF